MIWQPEFTDKTLSRKPGAVQTGRKNDSGESNKYRYEYNGQIMYWSGQGRRPSVIAEAIKAGGSLDDFLISQGTSSSCSDYE
ncbi:H-NS family nucleoid-associated regulatory protein [Escherichia coli]|nr:H-NS family nucleoid-associated regulatory protein [Escherichia coli]